MGYGKSVETAWSYITSPRAVMLQSGDITDPASVDDNAVIDTRFTKSNSAVSVGRYQDLVIGVVLLDGATLTADARIGLWLDMTWDSNLYTPDSSVHSSSSNTVPTSSSSEVQNSPTNVIDIPTADTVDEASRWCLVALEGPVPDGASYGAANKSIAVVFHDIVAGRYKAAVYTGLSGPVVITEQHTE